MSKKTLFPAIESDVVAYVADISPADADLLLSNRAPNRRPNGAHVERLAADMKMGGWLLTGQGIILDEDGRVQDGQNRLLAIRLSGVTCRLLVVEGVSRDVWRALDGGMKRLLSHRLQQAGQQNATTLAAALNFLWQADGGLLTSPKAPTTEQAMAILGLAKDLPESVSTARKVRDAAASTGTFAALHFMAALAGRKAIADVALEELATGANLEKGSPILALRNWLAAGDGKYTRTAQRTLATSIVAWNARLTGKMLNIVKAVRGGEDGRINIPEPFGLADLRKFLRKGAAP